MELGAGVGPVVVVGVVLVAQLVAAELGWRFAARAFPDSPDRLYSQALALQASVLGIVGLLLAFSFSMAITRFEARRALVLAESDAIGTMWLRTEALSGPERVEARALIVRYVNTRLAFFGAANDTALAAAVAEAEALQAELWAIVAEQSSRAPGSLPLALLVESLNDVIDCHADRLAVRQDRIPVVILVLLALASAIGIGTVGFSFGLSRGPHRLACALLVVLVSAILYVILDLDEPGAGRIRVSQESMLRLRESLVAP